VDNYYRALNIAPTATADEIKKVILRDRRLWSNRTNAPDLERKQEAERMVTLLANAEQILLDPARKQQYDLALRTAPVEQPQVNEAKTGELQDWIREGRRFLSDGDIPSALYAATQATQVGGTNPEAWALSAQAKFRWGQIPDAVYEYKRAINLRPNEAKYYFDLGSVYESTEDWTQALQQYQWAARVEPMSTMYRASVGETYLRLEKYPEAIATLQQCVADAPDNPTYRWFLAAAYADGAYEHWTHVLEGNATGVPEGYYATSKFQVDEALASVQKAQAINLETAEMRGIINGIHANIQSMLKRHFHGNRFAAGFAILLGLLFTLGGSLGGVLYLAFGVFYVVSCYTPQYLVNRRVIKGETLNSNGFFASIVLEGGAGCGGMVAGLVIIMLILPVMAIVNFLRNYVMAPQPTEVEKQQLALLQRTQSQAMPEMVMNQQQRR
jgi:tetratricopeptide (TPR) repeat protein